MKIRNISGSSITVSEIGIGGMNFGDQISEEQTFEVLDCAEELGINFIVSFSSSAHCSLF